MIDRTAHDALESYVLKAMNTWAPPSTQPDKDGSHYVAIARDIVEVVLDSNEKPIWDQRWKSAVLLAAISFWESRYWKHVWDGRCNDSKWQASKEGRKLTGVTGNCDGTWATSIFQIHAYDGIALTEDGWVGAWGAKGRRLLYGKDLLADGRVAVRVALHIARASIARSETLCGYSGENDDGCPKARARLDFAKSWIRKHPFKE